MLLIRTDAQGMAKQDIGPSYRRIRKGGRREVRCFDLAKLVASIDRVSAGRFLFGIGNGWNQDEMENHGTAFATRHKRARENMEAMKAIWDRDRGRIPRRIRRFRSDDGLAETVPETASADLCRWRVSLFGTPSDPLRRWLAAASGKARRLSAGRRDDSRIPPHDRGSRARPAGYHGLASSPGCRDDRAISGFGCRKDGLRVRLGTGRRHLAETRRGGGIHAWIERIRGNTTI